jgi:hypothetical protein
MPMIMLSIRIEIEVVFKNKYSEFFSKPNHEKVIIHLTINIDI